MGACCVVAYIDKDRAAFQQEIGLEKMLNSHPVFVSHVAQTANRFLANRTAVELAEYIMPARQRALISKAWIAIVLSAPTCVFLSAFSFQKNKYALPFVQRQ